MTAPAQTAWVLTYEVNKYDQEGAYFLAVFKSKPTAQQLVPHVKALDSSVDLTHVLRGGGRKKDEEVWFNLREESFS